MLKKCLSLLLIGLMAHLVPFGQALASGSIQDQTQVTQKIKAKIAKLGVGEKARVRIKLRNGRTIKGYVSSIGEDDFRLTERNTGQTETVAYGDVVEVKKPGLSKGAKIAIFAGIGAGVVIVVGFIQFKQFKKNCCFPR